MATTTKDGVSLHYETTGDGPTVVFLNDIGYGAWLWGWHHDAIAGPYEALVWDLRGTGDSDAPSGAYSVQTLAADLEAILADHGVRSAHLVGAGLGGMVALQYAHEYNRARTLTLYNTAADGGDIDADALDSLALDNGPERSLDGAFSPQFREAAPDLVDRIVGWREAEDATGDAFAAQAAAMTDFSAPPLYEVTQPAEVYYGVDDPVVPTAAAESLAADLPRGSAEAVEGRHLSFVEYATAVTDRLVAFLDEYAAE
ncbi:alpha/beta fold hydrolase [Haloarcula salinisoli]|uniref:Alpha/beta hydrolase n=1 Tax=Haloarcula salinisoli TaxID=2487746 RepID=A0A8J8C809_9EURY|nr:alpha/beta hydrolase [Halomicroarcula salinisoli]MBX0303852.1 alpha/beta hydrolase [Halomicroarcula salinisoli]